MKNALLISLFCLSAVFSNAQVQKKVVIEEFTGTWCQWCPRGTYFGDKVVHDLNNVILIAVHGGGSDPMDYTVYKDKTNLSSAPSGNLNRSVKDRDPVTWANDAQSILGQTTFAGVKVTPAYTSSNRELKVKVEATFASSKTGNYRLGAIVIEDAITGPSPSYDQSNSYSGSGISMGGFENLPNPVPAHRIAYDHVARKLLSPYEGEPGTVPSSVSAGSTHDHTFTFTLPANYDEEYVKVVGILVDQANGEIVNADQSKYILGNSNGKPHFVSKPIKSSSVGIDYSYDIFARDPDHKNLTITATGLPSWLTLVDKGKGDAELKGNPITKGNYNVKLTVSDGSASRDQVFTIVVDDSPSTGWEYVGNKTITTSKTRSADIALSKNNVPYIVTIDDQSKKATAYMFENGAWKMLGSPNFTSETSSPSIAIDQNNIPWIAYYTNSNYIEVMKFENNQWKAVGNTNQKGVFVDIAIDANNKPYVTLMDITSQSVGKVITYDGTSWKLLGNSAFSTGAATWQQILIDKQNNPYVLWNDYSNGKKPTVSTYQNGAWKKIGNAPVATDGVNFYQSIGIDNNNDVYVGFVKVSNNDIDVYKYDGSSWTSIGKNITSSTTKNVSLAVSKKGIVHVGYLDQQLAKRGSVISYENNKWKHSGPKGFTGSCITPKIAIGTNELPYIVYMDQSAGEKTSVKKYFDKSTNVHDLELNNELQLYPNPSEGVLILNTGKQQFSTYRIIDIQGKVVFNGQLKNKLSTQKIETNLPNGIYILVLEGNGATATSKFLINK